MAEPKSLSRENPPPTFDETEEELAHLARAVSRADLTRDDWVSLMEMTSLHADLRGATPSQMERHSRFSVIIWQRLGETEPD